LTRVKVMQDGEEIILRKVELEEFAKDIYKTIVGYSTLFFFTLYLGWFPDWVIGLIFLSAILWERG